MVSLMVLDAGRLLTLRSIDLIMDPFFYYEQLLPLARKGCLPRKVVVHLTSELALAIAQLDAVGDDDGLLVLSVVQEQLGVGQQVATVPVLAR